jgi:hypothetical protein
MPMKTSLATLALIAWLPAAAGAAGNISAADKYSWSETGGWINFAPSNGGVSVYDDHLEGYAWAENVGWIKLGSYSGGGYHRYANGSASDWGVNLDGSALSGYGWSEGAGWLRFDPSGGGVSLNPASGSFDGWAWSENLGWLHFKGGSPAYNVVFAPAPRVAGVLFDAADSQKMRAAVAGVGIRLSSDGGTTWSAARSQPGDRRLKALLASPLVASTLYAASYGGGVFKSSDAGQNWSACANGGLDPQVYALLAASNGTLYAATRGGVFASADCAAWTAKNSGLPSSGGRYAPTVLAVDPAQPLALYAGLDGSGIYKSSDGGANWQAATTQPGNLAIRALRVKPGAGSTLFAASYGGGVWKSGDGGATWAACAGQPANLNLRTLVGDAAGKLYAGSEAGVFVSSNDCASWAAMSAGLPN